MLIEESVRASTNLSFCSVQWESSSKAHSWVTPKASGMSLLRSSSVMSKGFEPTAEATAAQASSAALPFRNLYK